MMNSKVLPLGESPIVTYSSHANALSVLMPHEETHPHFFSNYIHLSILKDLEDTKIDVPLDFYMGVRKDFNYYVNHPYLRFEFSNFDMINSTCGDIVKYVIEANKFGLYVHLNLDEYYVPERKSYNTRAFYHENMVYGFDLSRRVFNIIGYRGTAMHFQPTEISFEDFEKAYYNCDPQRTMWKNDVCLMSMRGEHYHFDLNWVTTSLSDYLNATNISNYYSAFLNPKSHIAYGAGIYKYLKNNLMQNPTDYRPLHILWEHKRCMVDRLAYYHNNDYISNESYLHLHDDLFIDLAKKCRKLLDTQLKYVMTKQEKLMEEIVTSIDDVVRLEEEGFTRLLEELNRKK